MKVVRPYFNNIQNIFINTKMHLKTLFRRSLLSLIFLVCCNILPCYAQKISVADINKINELVSKDIYKFYKPDTAIVGRFCERGVFFVKFNVKSNSQITDLSFSKNSPQFIQEALTIALKKTQQNQFLMDLIKRSEKTILIPVTYNYQRGCFFNKTPQLSGDNDYYKKYLSAISDMDKFPESINNLLSFNDAQINGLDNIILWPITVGALGY